MGPAQARICFLLRRAPGATTAPNITCIEAFGLAHPLAERAGQLDLRCILEIAHVVEGLVGRATNEEHGPAVGPGVTEGTNGIGHAGSRHDNTGTDTAVEIRPRYIAAAGGSTRAGYSS